MLLIRETDLQISKRYSENEMRCPTHLSIGQECVPSVVGTFTKKPRKGFRKAGTKYLMQWRWRCTFRDAYHVCLLIWPWAHTKLPKINKIIEHYSMVKPEINNVVDFEHYKMKKGKK